MYQQRKGIELEKQTLFRGDDSDIYDEPLIDCEFSNRF
jgi:hypothetical protein